MHTPQMWFSLLYMLKFIAVIIRKFLFSYCWGISFSHCLGPEKLLASMSCSGEWPPQPLIEHFLCGLGGLVSHLVGERTVLLECARDPILKTIILAKWLDYLQIVFPEKGENFMCVWCVCV